MKCTFTLVFIAMRTTLPMSCGKSRTNQSTLDGVGPKSDHPPATFPSVDETPSRELPESSSSQRESRGDSSFDESENKTEDLQQGDYEAYVNVQSSSDGYVTIDNLEVSSSQQKMRDYYKKTHDLDLWT
eukprot:TRINITY_DN9876_c0_g1_i1.p1 TRINITY_DN9876_c0_g1~~TRINITY_DN9876_c0_g1_i1.p1  ORF type:complete len:129 (-),score=13.45 TRINITY_DN9876_c0_g1_i1:265-651(-)